MRRPAPGLSHPDRGAERHARAAAYHSFLPICAFFLRRWRGPFMICPNVRPTPSLRDRRLRAHHRAAVSGRRRAELQGPDGGAAHPSDLHPGAPPRGAVRRPRRPGPRRCPPLTRSRAPPRRFPPGVPAPASPPPPRLPDDFAWLVRLVGREAAGCGSQLQFLLTDPEFAALSPPRRRWGGSCARSAGCWASIPPLCWRRLPGARHRRAAPPRPTRYQRTRYSRTGYSRAGYQRTRPPRRR